MGGGGVGPRPSHSTTARASSGSEGGIGRGHTCRGGTAPEPWQSHRRPLGLPFLNHWATVPMAQGRWPPGAIGAPMAAFGARPTAVNAPPPKLPPAPAPHHLPLVAPRRGVAQATPEGTLGYCMCAQAAVGTKSAERKWARQWPTRPEVPFGHKSETRRCPGAVH